MIAQELLLCQSASMNLPMEFSDLLQSNAFPNDLMAQLFGSTGGSVSSTPILNSPEIEADFNMFLAIKEKEQQLCRSELTLYYTV
jgi:hypothetical protein